MQVKIKKRKYLINTSIEVYTSVLRIKIFNYHNFIIIALQIS